MLSFSRTIISPLMPLFRFDCLIILRSIFILRRRYRFDFLRFDACFIDSFYFISFCLMLIRFRRFIQLMPRYARRICSGGAICRQKSPRSAAAC